jgi:iron(III) transport system permease protein
MIRLVSERATIFSAALALVVLVGVPIALLLFAAIRGSLGYLPFEEQATFTTYNFTAALTQHGFFKMVLDTGLYVGGSVLVALVIGFVLAWLVERTVLPLPNVLFGAVLVPFLLPPTVILNAWRGVVLPRTGELNVFLRSVSGGGEVGPIDPFNLSTMVIAQGLLLAPLVFLVIAATLRNLDATMEEAGRASGANGFSTMRKVTLPLVFPAMFTATVLGIWLTLDSVDTPATFAAYGRLSLLNFRILDALTGNEGSVGYGLAAAYAVLAMAALVLLFLVYAYVARRAQRFATITGSSVRARRLRLGRWAIPSALFVTLYLAAMWGLPGYSLLKGSFQAGFSGYAAVLSSVQFWEAVFNSGVVAFGSATLGVMVVLLVAWTVVRLRKGWFAQSLDVLATAPIAVPALLAGLAFMLYYLTLNFLPLYGTLLGLTFALTFRLAIPYRITNAALRQIGSEMEEASAASGASSLTTLRRITWPLLAPAMAISWIFFFLFAVRESTITQFVGPVGPTFRSVRSFADGPGTAQAANVLIIVMVLAIVLLARYVLFRRARLL